jgi:hypothetical protein
MDRNTLIMGAFLDMILSGVRDLWVDLVLQKTAFIAEHAALEYIWAGAR